MRRTASGAAALLIVLVAVTACGGGDDEGPADRSTALPHDTASAAPARPAGEETPRHFIRRWVTAQSRMQHTGRTKAYDALSRSCTSCRTLARTVAGYYGAGGFIHGGAWRIDSITLAPSSGGGVTYVVRAEVTPRTVRESSSAPVQHVPGRRVNSVLELTPEEGSYSVDFWMTG